MFKGSKALELECTDSIIEAFKKHLTWRYSEEDISCEGI